MPLDVKALPHPSLPDLHLASASCNHGTEQHGCWCARDMFPHRAPVGVAGRLCAAILVALVFTGVGRAAANPACTVQV